MELTVDSSVFVSSLNENDPSFRDSLRALELMRTRGDHITIPSLVVMEVASALARNEASPQSNEDWGSLLGSFTIVPLDDKFISHFTAFVRTHVTSLKTSDEIIVLTAQFVRATLITLDQQMLAQGAKYVNALTPQQYLARS